MGSFTIFPSDNYVDLTIIQYGWEQCAPLHSYGPGVRNNYLFHYVLSGTGYVEYTSLGGAENRFQLKANSGFLIYPGEIVTYWADKNDPWKYMWVEFNGIQTSFCLELAGLSKTDPIFHPKSTEDAEAAATELWYIATHSNASSNNLIGHLYLFFDALATASAVQRKLRNQSQESYYMCEALSYIEQNYTRELKVGEIAAFCGLSRTHFGRLFKKTTGQSPQQYLTSFRLSKAIELMRTTNLSLGDIAAQIGYPNQLYFSKVFHHAYGIAPRTWRQEDSMVLRKPLGSPAKDIRGQNDDTDNKGT